MKCNQWTLGLAALGVVSLASVVKADEKPSSVGTALSSTMLSGYVDTSAQWNLGNGNAGAPAYAFGGPGKADGFNVNVVRLLLEKDPDASDAWGAGYKVDLIFGPDANALNTAGVVGGSTSDFALKQAYVDLKAPLGNGLDIKIGEWDTIIGYEVFQSGDNPNFTRSYGYTIEPTTHTGVLLGYTVNDMLSLQAGVANTFGPTIGGNVAPGGRAFTPVANGANTVQTEAESYKTYMASVALTAPTNWSWASGSTLYGCVINGFNNGSPATGTPAAQTSFYAGLTLNTPLTALKLGASYDYAGVQEQFFSQTVTATGLPTTQAKVGSGYANAFALYATYQATEKLSLNGRGEYFTQSGGASGLGLPTKVFALTFTPQYDLWKNVMTRLEFRWDHQLESAPEFGAVATGAGGAPLSHGTLGNSFEAIANIIYKF
jgi:hypothetical protein